MQTAIHKLSFFTPLQRLSMLLRPMQMMEKLLDRTHLEKHTKAPYPDMGVGYEMVQANDGSGLLSGVE